VSKNGVSKSLLAKLKSSDELRDQNEIMTTKLKELKLSLKVLKENMINMRVCMMSSSLDIEC